MREPRPIDYPSSSRVRTGTLYPGPDTGRPVVAVVHGLLAHRGLPEIEGFCRRLAARFAVVAIDLRGHGDAPDRFTWGREEPRDIADLVSFLRCLHPSVGVIGFSIGGAIAIVSAARARLQGSGAAPDALCTVCAPACLEPWRVRPRPVLAARHLRMLMRGGSGLPRLGLPRPGRARALDMVAGVAPIPLLLVHATNDWVVGARHATRLHARAGPPRELLLIPESRHAERLLVADPDPLTGPVAAFFERTLAGSREGDRPGAAGDVSLSRDRP